MDIDDKLRRLVEIPSVTGQEKAICDYLADQLGGLPGYVTDRVGNSLLVSPKERQGRQAIVLAGHLDTVPPFTPPRQEGGRIWGRGAADMKSGLAVMWQLLAEPVDPPCYDVFYLFYAGEEGPYEASELPLLLRKLPPPERIALAFCLEPSDNVLQLGCLGNIHARLTFRGRSAHSARPWEGENAIHRAVPLLARVAESAVTPVIVNELCFREVLNITRVEGGVASNVIPEDFVADLNYRFAPNRSLQAAKTTIKQLVGDMAVIAWEDLSPAGQVPSQNAVVSAFCTICQVEIAPKQAWTDVARFTEMGIDAVNFGPGESQQAHQPDESTSLWQLEAAEQCFRKFLSTPGALS